jgi:hypothetical protein
VGSDRHEVLSLARGGHASTVKVREVGGVLGWGCLAERKFARVIYARGEGWCSA